MHGEPDSAETPYFRQFVRKRAVASRSVYVSRRRDPTRDMYLEDWFSRTVSRGEVQELISAAERVHFPGTVRSVGYLGFVEILSGGTVRVGDDVFADGRAIGKIMGFDASHMPNHFNIVIQADEIVTGSELGLDLNSWVVIQ